MKSNNPDHKKQPKLVNGIGQGKYIALRIRQIKIETEAWENATKEYRELLVDMCEQKLAPNLPYVKSLFLGWFEPLKNAIASEQDLCKEGRNRGAYAPQFDQLPADMMTIITMHKLMGLLMTGGGQGGARVVQAALYIGEAVEHEIATFLSGVVKDQHKDPISVSRLQSRFRPCVADFSEKDFVQGNGASFDFQDNLMASMKAKLDMSKEELEAFFNDPDWDTTSVRGLGKLLSEILHTLFRNAIKRITEKGYSKETAENVILRCGPFHDIVGNLESNIVERALLSLESIKKNDDDSADYRFQALYNLVDFMTLEMVTTLRKIKPNLSIHDAVWTLLMCDLNILEASKAEIDLQQAVPGTETKSQPKSKSLETTISNVETPIGKKCNDTCNCKKWCSVANRKQDSTALRQKATLLLEKPYKGRIKGLKKKFASLKDLSLVDKLYSSSSSSASDEHNKNTSLLLKDTGKVIANPEVLSKTVDYHLRRIPCDEKGEYAPRDKKDMLVLDIVSQIQESQKELQKWDDWANSKVMEVTKRLSQHREEVNMLKVEKEEAKKVMKDNEATEESTANRLLETTRTLNTTNTKLNLATSAIIKLQSKQSVLKEDMETEKNQSLLKSRRLEQSLIKEEETLKKSQSFGCEKTVLEEELKALKCQVVPMERELEKAKCLLIETEIRIGKEEKENAKLVTETKSIKNERDILEDVAMTEYEMMKVKEEEELKKYETKKKRIEYEISVLKLEVESKRITAMQKSINMNGDSSKRLEVFKNMGKQKKKDRECVMCLNEEMIVVFLPCRHQVLCEACNVKHEKEMNDCPSCRTPIEKRITIQFNKS
ncbi:hypothetical protein L1887_13229 [Cichorium endivia]|nr:hypothetical protein L1887_13229 [Cichorium endivia]